MKQRSITKQSGFSLIELVLVIIILSILAVIAIPRLFILPLVTLKRQRAHYLQRQSFLLKIGR